MMVASTRFTLVTLRVTLSLLAVSIASGQHIDWARQFGSVGSAPDMAYATSADGNVYVAGWTGGIFPENENEGHHPGYLRKYDLDGNLLWSRQFSAVRVWGVAANGTEVYVVGESTSPVPCTPDDQCGGGGGFIRAYDPEGTLMWRWGIGNGSSTVVGAVSADESGAYVVGWTAGAFPPYDYSGGSSDVFVRKYDSAGNPLWTDQFGSSQRDYPGAIDVDSTGVYVAGTTEGMLPEQPNTGNRDGFVRKYNFEGNHEWTRQFGTGRGDELHGIDATASGIYVAGQTRGEYLGEEKVGYADGFVRKYDAEGKDLWTHQFGNAVGVHVTGVVSAADRIYVSGWTSGEFSGEAALGGPDGYIHQYDPADESQWTRQFGSPGEDQAFGIAHWDTGLYVVGRTTGTFPNQTSFGSSDGFLARYDLAGLEIWTRQFGGVRERPDVAAAVDVDGSIYLAGTAGGDLPQWTSDAFVRKYDYNGNEIWASQFGTDRPDGATGLSIGATGVYVVGFTEGVFDDEWGEGGTDGFVRKYDFNGDVLWTRQFGTAADDESSGVSANAMGIYVTGSTTGQFDDQTQWGEDDAFLRKYGPDGNHHWTEQFGTPDSDRALGISSLASSVYVCGSTFGSMGQSPAGGEDAFVRRFDGDGNPEWTRQFGSLNRERANAVFASVEGIYLAGSTYGELPEQASSGSQDGFVQVYEPNGQKSWSRQFGTASLDEAFGIFLGAEDLFVVGATSGTFVGQTSEGVADAYVYKLSMVGGENWVSQFGTVSRDAAFGVAAEGSGVYVVGETEGTFPGERSLGRTDAFVARIASCEMRISGGACLAGDGGPPRRPPACLGLGCNGEDDDCDGQIDDRDEDVVDPTLFAPPEALLECVLPHIADTRPEATGFGTAADDCHVASVEYEDSERIDGCGRTFAFVRQWSAVDSSGNTDRDMQGIQVVDTTQPVLDPPDDRAIECVRPIPDTSPAATGFASATDACDPIPTVGFSDVVIPQCGLTFDVARTWTAADDCGNQAPLRVQSVRLADTTKPLVATSVEPGTNPAGEKPNPNAGYRLLGCTAVDACDPDVDIDLSLGGVALEPAGENIKVVNNGQAGCRLSRSLVGGTIKFFKGAECKLVCTSTDACGNVATNEVDL